MDFAFLQYTEDTANQSTYTYSSENLGVAAADRYIIVAVNSRRGGNPADVTSVTIGGVSATIVVEQANSDANSDVSALAIANVPTGTTGDVVVVYTATMARASIGVYRATGIDSATPYDSGSSTAADPTFDIDCEAGGFVIGTACSNSNTTTTWSGITEDWDDEMETYLTHTGASDEFVSAQTNLTCTANFGSAGSTPCGVFASWSPAASDPTTDVSDSVTVTDSWPGYYEDTIEITEYVDVVLSSAPSVLNIDVNDSITLSEDTTTLINFLNVNVNDSLTISEDITTLINYLNINVSDSISLSEDDLVNINNLFIDVSDSISLSEDSTTLINNLVIDVSDSISLSEDSITLINTLYINVNDDVTLTEDATLSKTATQEASGDDAITVTDTLPEYHPESITISEYVDIQIVDATPNPDVNDSITLTENIDVVIVSESKDADASDSITVTDSLPEYHPESITVTEYVDVQIADATTDPDVNDSITITEYTDVSISSDDKTTDVSDSITVTDTLPDYHPETITITEYSDVSVVTPTANPEIDTSDSITITESSSLAIYPLSVDVNDSITITESGAPVTVAATVYFSTSDGTDSIAAKYEISGSGDWTLVDSFDLNTVFGLSSPNVQGVEWDGTDIYIVQGNGTSNPQAYRQDGFSITTDHEYDDVYSLSSDNHMQGVYRRGDWLYFVNSYQNGHDVVYKVDYTTGTVDSSFTITFAGTDPSCQDIYVDASENVYLTDIVNDKIWKTSGFADSLDTSWDAPADGAIALSKDGAGNFIIADQGTELIYVYYGDDLNTLQRTIAYDPSFDGTKIKGMRFDGDLTSQNPFTSVSDTVTITESSTVNIAIKNVEASESITISESVEIENSVLNVNVSDDITITDELAGYGTNLLNINTYDIVGQKIPKLIFVDGMPAWRLFGRHYTLL